MSVVSNVAVFSGVSDWGENDDGDYFCPLLEAWKDPDIGRGQLNRVDQYAGGTKVMECSLYIAAFNHLDVEGFVASIAALPWKAPEDVIIVINHEYWELPHDEPFRTYRIAHPDRRPETPADNIVTPEGA